VTLPPVTVPILAIPIPTLVAFFDDIGFNISGGERHPMVTCLLLSVGLSLIFWLFSLFRR
jgi:hypothetical protein